jgi:hypothetical protein
MTDAADRLAGRYRAAGGLHLFWRAFLNIAVWGVCRQSCVMNPLPLSQDETDARLACFSLVSPVPLPLRVT